MDRFQLETTSDLAAAHTRYMAVYVWGEDVSAHTSEEPEEPLRDGDCSVIHGLINQHVEQHTSTTAFLAALKLHAESDCRECAALARAEQLLELEAEAPCTCRQSDADLFDASGCEFHNPNSPWNVRMRALTSVELYEGMVA